MVGPTGATLVGPESHHHCWTDRQYSNDADSRLVSGRIHFNYFSDYSCLYYYSYGYSCGFTFKCYVTCDFLLLLIFNLLILSNTLYIQFLTPGSNL